MHAIDFRGIKKTYATGTEAVKGIDFAIEEGDFFGLLGARNIHTGVCVTYGSLLFHVFLKWAGDAARKIDCPHEYLRPLPAPLR